MEKLVYLLRDATATPATDLRERLLATCGERLAPLCPGPLSLLVADEAAETVSAAAIRRSQPPVVGMVSLWLDCADARGPVEAALDATGLDPAGYLVAESVPIRNTTHAAPRGERTPGITMLALLERPARLDFLDWVEIWHHRHTPLAIEIQCTYRYVRNVVVRPLRRDAPPFAGLVEEGFPADAVTDPMRWYQAGGDPQKLGERVQQMVESVKRFLDIERVESLPMSEYVLRDA